MKERIEWRIKIWNRVIELHTNSKRSDPDNAESYDRLIDKARSILTELNYLLDENFEY